MLGETILNSRPNDRIKPIVTLENPPPSNHPKHLSAWELPEVQNVVNKMNLTKVDFTTCRFQSDVEVGRRTYKPQRFAGFLLGLRSLGGDCPCGERASHNPVIGKQRSVESGHYPRELCEAYANLVMEHFVRMGTSEFYSQRAKDLEEEVSELRKKSVKQEPKNDGIEQPGPSKKKRRKDTAVTAKREEGDTAKTKDEDEYTYEYETEEEGNTKEEVKSEAEDKAELRDWKKVEEVTSACSRSPEPRQTIQGT